MTIRDIAEVRARLEEAVAGLPGEPASPKDLLDRYEMVGTQIIDSEFMDYEPDGALIELISAYIWVRAIEIGAAEFPDPRED
jgi:hypothetical protein